MTVSRDDLAFLGAAGLARLVAARPVSPADLVDVYPARIAKLDRRFPAFITVCAERAQQAAREAEQAGADGPLYGVPFAVKDQFHAKGLPTTCGSRLLEHAIAADDATTVARLEAAGAILLGKLSLSEFAL